MLAAARAELARPDQPGSYAAIIARAGISKTSAYLYFDGKDDVVLAVKDDLIARLQAVVGPWAQASSRTDFFERLAAASTRLHQHLVRHPDDLQLLSTMSSVDSAFDDWFEALVRDGLRLELIRSDVPFELMVASTRAVVATVDEWSIGRLLRGQRVDPCEAVELLKGLWGTPTKRGRTK
ncbi:MAG: TetR/AcrR family transcriptional regulator [Archangiaceae bacterium]|nr:TetR/AcrR family transcriptional regulator [Archangiaceae bacterium]